MFRNSKHLPASKRLGLIFISLFLFCGIALISCSWQSLPIQIPFLPTASQTFTPSPSPTITPSPTSTSTPTPTLTPTPIPAARIGEADMLLYEGEFDQAGQDFQTALDAATNDELRAAALVGLGRVALLKGDFASAVNYLREVQQKYSDSQSAANSYFFMAQALKKSANYPKAAEAYHQFLTIRPGAIDAYAQELRGDALGASNDAAGAIEAYQAAIQAPRLNPPLSAQIKIGRLYDSQNDFKNAIRTYLAVYDASTDEYIRSQMNFLAGTVYVKMGMPEQAYARYQDSIQNYPHPIDSYNALLILVQDGVAVDDLARGIVDYYAGQYGYALQAFDRYIQNNPEHDGKVNYFKALTYTNMNQPEQAIAEWDTLIKDHPGDKYFNTAWDEKAYTLWAVLNRHRDGAQVLLDFVARYPNDPQSAQFLFDAARIYERHNDLADAATTWDRVIVEYPSADPSYRALFLSGIAQFRMNQYDLAMTTFQRCLALAANPGDQAAAHFWTAKVHQKLNDEAAARKEFAIALTLDPTGYYSERSGEILDGLLPFSASDNLNFNYDLAAERSQAQSWMRITFNLASDTDYTFAPLASNPHVTRGDAYWQLGLYAQSQAEFEALRTELNSDALGLFRLIDHLVQYGFYNSAIQASRQVLNLAGMDDAGTLSAPGYFNHIRFGLYYKDIVLDQAKVNDFNPLLLFSVIRQESLFGSYAESGAGAHGLMQIMPATGDEIARNLAWPPNYTVSDLDRPSVNITMGAHYLDRQRRFLQNDIYASLAAYNGGPGNAQAWKDLSYGDPDLFLEVIRYDETRSYVMRVYENFQIFRRLYEKK